MWVLTRAFKKDIYRRFGTDIILSSSPERDEGRVSHGRNEM